MERHSDDGTPPATKHGYGTHGCSGFGHSGQPSDASDAATIDVFKKIEALCDREQGEDPDSVIRSIMQFNQQRLEKAKPDDILFSRLTKRKNELTQAGEFLSDTDVELIGFIGWGEGCIEKLTHGNGSSAVEGFLYRQNGITTYQRLGSSLGIFNQLTPEQQQSNDSIDGPFASEFAQIIEIKGPDDHDIHKVYSYNPTDPSTPIQKNLNDMYPNGYGILQSKKAAKYLLEFHDWFHNILQKNSKFNTWWHDNFNKFRHNPNDKSIDSNFLKIKSVHDPLHDKATKKRLEALANNQGSVFTHSVGIDEDFSQHLATLSKSLVENNNHAFLGL